MVQQIINVGIKANTGGGDPLRDAMIKVNENFTEVYGKLTALEDGNVVTDIKGNVFSEDSTLLVDGINSSINLDGTVKGDIVPDTDVAYDIGSASKRFRDLYLSGSTIDLGGTTLSVVGGELQLGGVKIPTQAEVTASIAGAVAAPTGDLTGSVFADDSTLLVDGVNGRLVGPLLTENISHPSNDGLGIRLNSTDQSTLLVAKQSFDRTFDETFGAGYTLSMLNTPNRVRVTFDENNGLYFRGLLERWTILFENIGFGDPSDFEYDYSNIRLSLEPDAYDIVTNVVDVDFVSDNVYDIEIDQDPITALSNAGAEPGEISQIALRYDYNNTMGFDVERNRYGIAVDHDDIDLRAGRDIDLFAVDDFRARAGSTFNLTLESKDGRDPAAGLNINLESYDAGNLIDKIWAFQFDGNLRLPIGGDIVDDNGNSVLKNLDGDLTGSVFADDSTLLVDGVNGRLVGPLLTNSIASPATGNLELDVGRENGGAFIVTAWADKSDPGNGWKQILWGYDGGRYEFYVGGDIATQGSITTNNVTANGLIARQGQYLYVTSAHAGGSATNAAFIYDTDNSRPRQTFYGKTEFGNNGAAPIVDFNGTTIQNWTDPNVVNTHSGSTVIAVGGQTATIDKLTVRLVNDGSNNIDVQFNYDPDVTSEISASGDSDNRFGGTTTLAPGNTTWTTLNSITTIGTTRTFTVSDHSFHKVYRGTVICRAMPDVGTVGDAYCILERLL